MKLLIVLLTCAISTTAFAGGDQGGGGDIKCDAEIKSIVSNLQWWTQNSGPEVGQLDLSSSQNPNVSPMRPYTEREYERAMLKLYNLPLDSSCVVKGDSDYPVDVGDATKICKSSVDNGELHMICDQKRFFALNANQRIEQIHHEYAIHVPGLEPDSGAISTYKISMQLSAYTRNETERMLEVLPKPSAPPDPAIYGEWVSQPVRRPAGTTENDVIVYTQRILIEPGKVGAALTCKHGWGSKTVAAVVTAKVTATQIAPRYTGNGYTKFWGWFTPVTTCSVTIYGYGKPMNYTFDGNHLFVGGIEFRRASRSALSSYPLSSNWGYDGPIAQWYFGNKGQDPFGFVIL